MSNQNATKPAMATSVHSVCRSTRRGACTRSSGTIHAAIIPVAKRSSTAGVCDIMSSIQYVSTCENVTRHASASAHMPSQLTHGFLRKIQTISGNTM